MGHSNPGEIIVHSRSIINAYSLLSHEWWIPLIKFMVGPTIYVRGGVRIYGTPGVPNNLPKFLTFNSKKKIWGLFGNVILITLFVFFENMFR